MPENCPHCAKELEGYVKQDVMVARLKAKSDEAKLLTDRIAEIEPLAKAAAEVTKERDTLKTAIAELTEGVSRNEALVAKGVVDKRTQDAIAVLYRSEMASREAPVAFGEWLEKDAPAHPLLAPAFAAKANGTAAAAPPPAKAPAAPAVKPVSPNAQAAPADAPATGKWTPKMVQEYFASPAYRSLKPDERLKERARLETEIAGQRINGT